MGAYDLKLIDIAIADHVAVATMTNPPVNALSRQMQDEMALAFDLMSDDDSVRVIVLTG
jgi:enoyl-CoA hydratase/carnithine racemase